MVEDTADDFKAQGNRLFSQQRYREAIESYTKAINKNSRVSTYYTNRALAYTHLKLWSQAAADCLKAVELDRSSVKAYYLLGKAEVQLEQYDDAIKHLAQAVNLASQSSTNNYGDEIHAQLRVARRMKFRREEDKRLQQEIDLVQYVERLIDEDKKRRNEKLLASSSSEEMIEDEAVKISQEADNYKAQLNELLSQVDDRRRRREIPDYLCGKISFELMKDPVITPSGITYDRNDIKQHLHRVGHFDPVSRESLVEDQLIPNYAMKEVIEAFMKENPWAEFDDPETD